METPTALLWVALIIAIILFAASVMWGSTSTLSLFVPSFNNGEESATKVEEDDALLGSAQYAPVRYKEKNYYVTEVNYMGTRFVPQVVTVDRGELVRFINKDNLSMRITSQGSDHVQTYPGFDQQNSVGTGGKYDFVFNNPGVWPYRNLNGDPGIVGIIYVR